MTVKLSIIVVSYNTRELILECVRSLYAQTKSISFELHVVDNASADGSADALAAEFPQARLTRLSQNIGFASANNIAAKLTVGEYLLLLNPDTLVKDCAIERLLAFAESHADASILGGRTLFADGSLNPASCWRRAKPWSAFCTAMGLTSLFPRSNIFSQESYGRWRRDSMREVDIVSGCFLLIRRSLWQELGGFDPAFFMYGEEADLCLRAAEKGHRCLITPDATIIHYGGASEKTRADKMVKLFKAKAMLAQRHWKPGWRWFGRWCFDLWALVRLSIFGPLALFFPSRRESFRTWLTIWNRRQEWHKASILSSLSASQNSRIKKLIASPPLAS